MGLRVGKGGVDSAGVSVEELCAMVDVGDGTSVDCRSLSFLYDPTRRGDVDCILMGMSVAPEEIRHYITSYSSTSHRLSSSRQQFTIPETTKGSKSRDIVVG